MALDLLFDPPPKPSAVDVAALASDLLKGIPQGSGSLWLSPHAPIALARRCLDQVSNTPPLITLNRVNGRKQRREFHSLGLGTLGTLDELDGIGNPCPFRHEALLPNPNHGLAHAVIPFLIGCQPVQKGARRTDYNEAAEQRQCRRHELLAVVTVGEGLNCERATLGRHDARPPRAERRQEAFPHLLLVAALGNRLLVHSAQSQQAGCQQRLAGASNVKPGASRIVCRRTAVKMAASITPRAATSTKGNSEKGFHSVAAAARNSGSVAASGTRGHLPLTSSKPVISAYPGWSSNVPSSRIVGAVITPRSSGIPRSPFFVLTRLPSHCGASRTSSTMPSLVFRATEKVTCRSK
jgi:hypothetical protein